LSIRSQTNICTARFLQKFIVSENSLCSLFVANAARQLSGLELCWETRHSHSCTVQLRIRIVVLASLVYFVLF